MSMRTNVLAGLVVALLLAVAMFVIVGGPGADGPAAIGSVGTDGSDTVRIRTATLAGDDEQDVAQRAALEVDLDGSGTTSAEVPTLPWPTDGIDLVVVDATTGEQVPHALVRFVDPREHVPSELVVGPDYRLNFFDGLQHGVAAIRCDDRGLARVPYGTMKVVASTAGLRGEGRLSATSVHEPVEVLVHPCEVLVVRVMDSDGRPVPDAWVVLKERARGDSWTHIDTSSSNGSGRVEFEYPRRWNSGTPRPELLAELVGVFEEFVRVNPIREGAVLVQPDSGSVVVDFEQGAFANGQRINLVPYSAGEGMVVVRASMVVRVSDAEARFRPVEVGLPVQLWGTAVSPFSNKHGFSGPRHAGEEVQVVIGRTLRGVRGQIVDCLGASLASTRIELAPLGQPFERSERVLSLFTDPSGAFESVLPEDVDPGSPLVVRHPMSGGRSTLVRLPEFGEDKTADLGTVVLRRDLGRVEGVVLGHNGPLPGATIVCAFAIPIEGRVDAELGRVDRQMVAETGVAPGPGRLVAIDTIVRTGEDGRFSVVVPPDASVVYFVVTHPSHHDVMQGFALPAGDVRIVLEPDPVLVGRVTAPDAWGDLDGLATVSPDATTERVRFRDPKAAAHFTAQAWIDRGDSFLFRAPTFEPVGLELWSRSAARVIADLGSYAPGLDKHRAHSELDPLDLARFVRLVEVAIEPPRTDSGTRPSLEVRIEDTHGEVWWCSAGATTGPWDARILLPIDHVGDLIVRSDRCQPESVPAGVERHLVQLELGPGVLLRLASLAQLPDGVRLGFELVVGDAARELRPDDDGVVRDHLSGLGPVQLRMTAYVPSLDEGEIRDPRWDTLDGVPLELAAFDVGGEGVELDVAVPDLAGLVRLLEER